MSDTLSRGKLDISLEPDFLESYQKAIKQRNFSSSVRMTIQHLVERNSAHPTELAEEVQKWLGSREQKRSEFRKRLTVVLSEEEISQLNSATEALKQKGVMCTRTDLLRFSLANYGPER